MRTLAYSVFRENMKTEFQRCRDDAEPLLVSNKDPRDNVVVINARDYDALMETIRIYENSYLHEKIRRGKGQIKAGEGVERELLDA